MEHPLKRIAYVEDDDNIRELTEMTLSAIGGFDVAVFASGEEAVEGLEAFEPDFVLLDVMMPGMTGPQVFAWMRGHERLADVPTAFMTAKTQESEIATLMNLGAAGVVRKPFDPVALSGQVRAMHAEVWSSRGAA